MTENNCGIIVACLVAFGLCLEGKKPLNHYGAPYVYTPDDDVVPLIQLRETHDDVEMIHLMN